jgi:AraC-like DNA-binding protein
MNNKFPIQFVRDISLFKVDLSLQSADEIGEMLSKRFSPVLCEPVGHNSLVGITETMGVGEGIEFSVTQFKYGMRVQPQEPFDGILFAIPLEKTISWGRAGQPEISSPGKAIAMDMRACPYFECAPGLLFQRIDVSYRRIRERLSLLLDQPLILEIVFQSVVELNSGQLKGISMLVNLLTSPEFKESLSFSPIAASRLVVTLIDMLIESWPNNYSEQLRQKPVTILPRHVKLALSCIHDNADNMPTPDELATLCNVSLRSLQNGFNQFVGTSIVSYQRKVRLERARIELLAGRISVEAAARHWGFSNPGRFTRYFREAFGVSPADIVRIHTIHPDDPGEAYD